MNDPSLKIAWSKFILASCLGFSDLAFPNEPSPFHDVRIRRAASLAINRKAICENVVHGAAEPWGDILAPYQPGFDPNVKPHPYDPEKARALLKEAGYPNGFETTFTSGHPAGDKIEVQAIAADLARVGIKGKIIELEGGTYLRNLFEKKFRGIFVINGPYWTGMWHPGVTLESRISSKNPYHYYTSPEAEAAWMKLVSFNDEKIIAAQARELSRIWHESDTKPILWAIHQPFGLSARVKFYNPIPGWAQLSGCEYLELKE
jgi:peptide/nickel transport system substrate-binding protein